MIFPVPQATAITDGYDAPRPQPKWRQAKHWALDVAAPHGSWIVAPERGQVVYHYIVAIGANAQPELKHDGRPWPFGRWYTAQRYGATVALLARDRWWLITHMEPTTMFTQCFHRGLHVRGEFDHHDFHRAEAYTTLLDEPWPTVQEGEIIGLVGSAGRSSGPHTHLELHPPGGATRPDERLDPSGLWPEMVERLMGR